MDTAPPSGRAEATLPCPDIAAGLAFYVDRLGFKLQTIFPADDPRWAVLEGHGLRLRLDRELKAAPVHLRLHCQNPGSLADTGRLEAPGAMIELLPLGQPLKLPPPAPTFQLARFDEDAAWVEGRAGMRYRDLIPDRQGGRFIASHISIPEGGPVPDYVHFHKARFQVIYCYKGWVRVVYEDQGEPFTMHPGDCALQPPEIRHRVLEASAGLEVIELGCPAEHETHVDHELALPNETIDRQRRFDGQRFVFHRAAGAPWVPCRLRGFMARYTGINEATDGLASVRALRPNGETPAASDAHQGEFLFFFVLAGSLRLTLDDASYVMREGDACTLPAGAPYSLTGCSPVLSLLEVALPGAL